MDTPRPAGLDLKTMYEQAHGGNPQVAVDTGTGFKGVSQSLGQISRNLGSALGQIGDGWQGQGAQAARAGMGQHVQWAQSASQQAGTIAASAGQYADSAIRTIPQIPSPAEVQAARAAAGGTGGPAGPNIAAMEQAEASLKQKAIQAMQGHANVCQASTPSAALTAPPAAGSAAGTRAAGATERAAARGRGAEVRAPGANAGGAASSAATGGRTTAASSVRQATPVDETSGRSGAYGRPNSARGFQPGGFNEIVPGTNGHLAERSNRRAPRGAHQPAAAALPGSDEQSRKPGGGTRPTPAAVMPGGAGHRPQPSRPTPRQLAARGEGHLDGGQPSNGQLYGSPPPGTEQAGTPGHGGPQQGVTGTHGGMVPPMMGGSGMGGSSSSEQRHQTPTYLLDDFELFDGDSWVVPPVIGK